MFNWKRLHKNEQGQAALETAIILIAFVVVAAVFAFTILSAGNSSTEKGKQAIAAGLSSVQSSMSIKGAVIANSADATKVDSVVFTVSLVAGGTPVNLNDAATENTVVIGYRDATQVKNELVWEVAFIGQNNGDDLLEEGELAEITVKLDSLTTPLAKNTQFTVEVKPPTGSVLNVTRTTPAALAKVMDLN